MKCIMCNKIMEIGEKCIAHPLGYTCQPCWVEWRKTFVTPDIENIRWDTYNPVIKDNLASFMTELVNMAQKEVQDRSEMNYNDLCKMPYKNISIFVIEEAEKSILIDGKVLILTPGDWDILSTKSGIILDSRDNDTLGYIHGIKVSTDMKAYRNRMQSVLNARCAKIIKKAMEKTLNYEEIVLIDEAFYNFPADKNAKIKGETNETD